MIHGRKRHNADRFFRAFFTFLILLLTLVVGVPGQQPVKRGDPISDLPTNSDSDTSDLTKENFDRVAASPILLKDVLISDPGLMVELKRWIAKQASDNGQLVPDKDLTDAAVFDRLTSDVKFRSVATRLVQRYGYLLPSVNPSSGLGKEQDLLLKERARRLVQIEAQEDADSINSRKQGTSTVEAQTSTCRWNADGKCNPTAVPPSRRSSPDGNPQRDLPRINPNDQPSGASPRLIQAETIPDSPADDRSEENNAALENVSSADPPKDGPNPRRSWSAAYPAPVASDRLRGVGSGGLDSSIDEAIDLTDTSSPSGTRSIAPRESRLARDRESSQPSTVHRPNPYTYIPSLYDLYVQAPSRDIPPQRFGAAVFNDGLRDPRNLPMDLPVGPDYIVGPGDSLKIDLWGSLSTRLVRVVDRQGRVNIPDAGPLLVSGRSLGEIQQSIQKAISDVYRDTSADVSVSRLRTIRIYVVGEVQEPGAYDISSLSTALNALIAAGGVTAKGSLRSLRHMRGRQQLEEIDAYDLLLHGVSPDAKKLENGDTLLVPAVGPEITVTGMVRRPAIYELNGESSIQDVLGLAGGILPAAALQHVEVQRLEAHQNRTMLSLDLSPEGPDVARIASFRIQDGDIIHIFPIAPYSQSTIYLQGHVLKPGRYSFHDGMTLGDLISSYQDLLPEPAGHYAEIVRLNPPDFRPSVVSFDLTAAMKDPSHAPQLQSLDTVRIFSRFDFEPAPTVSISGEVRSPGVYRTSGQVTLRDAVYLAGGLTQNAALNTAQVFRFNPDGSSEIFSVKLGDALNGGASENIALQPRDHLLIHTNTSRVQPSFVEITGEVAKPGRYPYTANMKLQDLVRASGGLKPSADTTKADLTSYSTNGAPDSHTDISLPSLANGNPTEDVLLNPGDVLSIREKTGWKNIGASVKISGEVMHAGTFGIKAGERLSSVLERAGGFTSQAYPYGAVLMRRDVREAEELARASMVQRIQTEQASLQVTPEANEQEKNAKASALAQVRSTLHELEVSPPIGRVVIHIQDPFEKWKNTSSDIAMRDGDVLLIPSRTGYIMVNGQVFHPTAVSYRGGKSANWYLSQAGGLTPLADKKAAFVLRADGSVVSASNNSNFFSGDPLNAVLRSGDVVVVPEKALKIGGRNWSVIMQGASVAASTAVAAAYIHP